ncbi:hypothetical protein [Apocheima cinerarium nucleopolyhedrovirus]|uniref:hypothetical protein n=1 Tax=Apocheima cinerarium nucleopolyhedrovirus TaxID=307461 RepID=UPI0001D9203C|nr:hypothetical protein [Apocheima cinerarium nucleopolyhedrovirus]ADB84368.1 hypothetical protein [Apocheima cinerarium nucleopolyhedrovirus]
MSTLRNKCLLKYLNTNALILSSNLSEVKNQQKSQQLFTKQQQCNQPKSISLDNFRKISKAFFILKNSNEKMEKCIKNMANYYEREYEMKLQRLRTLLNKKTKKMQMLRQRLNFTKRYIIIVRNKNEFLFYTNATLIKVKNFRVVIYKLSEDPNVDRSVCVSVAKTKYQNLNITNKSVYFDDFKNADSYEKDLKEIFNSV